MCDSCDYTASAKITLKAHIKSKYLKVKYPCDKCEFAATTAPQSKSKHKDF